MHYCIPHQPGIYVNYLYEAMYLYGLWVNHTLTSETELRDGAAWFNFTKNISFDGKYCFCVFLHISSFSKTVFFRSDYTKCYDFTKRMAQETILISLRPTLVRGFHSFKI